MHREQNYGCEEVPEVEPPPPMDHDVMTSTKAHDHTYEWLDDRGAWRVCWFSPCGSFLMHHRFGGLVKLGVLSDVQVKAAG